MNCLFLCPFISDTVLILSLQAVHHNNYYWSGSPKWRIHVLLYYLTPDWRVIHHRIISFQAYLLTSDQTGRLCWRQFQNTIIHSYKYVRFHNQEVKNKQNQITGLMKLSVVFKKNKEIGFRCSLPCCILLALPNRLMLTTLNSLNINA